ncbi:MULTISPECIES: hypothetical protein [Nocardioides]|uniref:Polysaccharide chain length determinant N-terminal domain-containing protein n=1 Tax=Nocardioides vastitatis TaxID=2568655 RepID=A0ABW0ZIT7_9ACTN|nr:hypothetical protein [Nocardioides sp.]THI96660.1 hypothetical protein E7Z54_16560 [Nocardioides sp.]
MAEQAVDLRSALAAWTRHRLLMGLAGLLGAAAGVGLAQVVPPYYTSTSQVLLPIAPAESEEAGDRDRDTEIEIASSDVVLGPAGRAVSPQLTPAQAEDMVSVEAPSDDVIAFRVRAESPAQAEALAKELAKAEVAYSNGSAGSLTRARSTALVERRQTLKDSLDAVSAEIETTSRRAATVSPTSPAGRADAAALAELTAQQANLVLQLDSVKSQLLEGQGVRAARVIESATPATSLSAPMRYGLFGAGGLFAGVLLTGLVLAVAGRRDRRLRSRDDIADALGCSVVTSVRARRPRSVSAWRRLLASYAPDTVDAWALRRILHRVHPAPSFGSGAGSAVTSARASVIVITLTEDEGALAMAPQLASYAATTGVATRLVIHGRDESAAALRAAAGRETGSASNRREGLLLGAEPGDAELTVILVVVDRKRPVADDLVAAQVDIPDGRATTLVAVASGFATAQELARAAVLMDDQQMRIDGVIVADPDDLDRTTGRVGVGGAPPGLLPPGLPTRLAAVPITRSGSSKGYR